MSLITVTESETFKRLSCSECGVVYYFPQTWTDEAKVSGKSWKCPNGHGQWFGEGEIDKIRRERDRLKQNQAFLEQRVADEERAKKRALAEAKRVKKRATAALCPCCNRHFNNVEAHMKKEHPEIVKLPERKLPA